MIGGEAAECSALARRSVADDLRDPYELGWVVDWLYGDASLPPMPLPPEPEPLAYPRRRHLTPVSEQLPAARAEPRVRTTPSGPEAFVVRFAENGIDLELGVWINDPEHGQLNLRSAINRRIWTAFNARGIRIPFPQREYRVLGADGTGASAAAPTSTADSAPRPG